MNIQVSIKLRDLAELDKFLLSRGIDSTGINAAPVKWAWEHMLEMLRAKGLLEPMTADEAFGYLQKRGYSLKQVSAPHWRRQIVKELSLDDLAVEARPQAQTQVKGKEEAYTIQELIEAKGTGVLTGLRALQTTPEFRAMSNTEQDLAIQAWIDMEMTINE